MVLLDPNDVHVLASPLLGSNVQCSVWSMLMRKRAGLPYPLIEEPLDYFQEKIPSSPLKEDEVNSRLIRR